MTARLQLEKAHAAMKEGKLDEATSLCDAVIKDEPDLSKGHQLRALIAIKAKDLLAAETHIQTALNLSPEDPECLNTYGNILKTTGRTLEAMNAYKKSLKAAPNYLPAVQQLGQLYLGYKDPLEAIDIFQTALTHYPEHPGLMRGVLFGLKDSGQLEAAKDFLLKIPNAPDLALTAGQIFSMLGQFPQAKSAFGSALSDPNTANMAFRNLINLIWMREGIDAVNDNMDKLLTASPNAGFVYLEGADLYADMGDMDAGLSLLDKCETQFGKQPAIDHARARIFIEQDKGTEAFQLAAKALSAQKDDLGFLSTYARAALMTRQFQEALNAAKHAQARQRDNQFWIALEASALRGLAEGGENDYSAQYRSLYDYENWVQAYDLEAPAEYKDMSDFLGQLKDALTMRHNSENHPIGQSLRYGTQTPADLRFADSRVIQDFFQALAAPVNAYMATIGDSADHPFTRRNSGQYRLSGAWSVKLQAGGFHVNHVHPEGWISSAFYVDVPGDTDTDPDKKGWIKFGEPPFAVPGQSYEHMVAPKPGRLVLFPSYMWHGTLPIDDGVERMTLPFDVVPV